MGKLALVIRKDDAPAAIRDATAPVAVDLTVNTLAVQPFLADRDLCETDPTLLQLIPYMVVVTNIAEGETPKVLCYSRGAQGGEARLHAKLSIGIGGHVDVAPGPDDTLSTLLIDEALREYGEEIGGRPFLGPYPLHAIFDPTNEVGQVHLGIVCVAVLDEETGITPEAGMIENHEWKTWEELYSTEYFSRMETWSQIVLSRPGLRLTPWVSP